MDCKYRDYASDKLNQFSRSFFRSNRLTKMQTADSTDKNNGNVFGILIHLPCMWLASVCAVFVVSAATSTVAENEIAKDIAFMILMQIYIDYIVFIYSFFVGFSWALLLLWWRLFGCLVWTNTFLHICIFQWLACGSISANTWFTPIHCFFICDFFSASSILCWNRFENKTSSSTYNFAGSRSQFDCVFVSIIAIDEK